MDTPDTTSRTQPATDAALPSGSLLIFGATGQTGVELVRRALRRGYDVTAFVRSHDTAGAKLGSLATEVHLIAGDALNPDDVRAAFEPKPTAVILALGIYQAQAGGNELARATGHILDWMRQTGVRRVINISSLGVGDSRQQGNFIARLIQRTTLRHTLADKELQEQRLRDSGLDWTNVRPSRLVNGDGPAAYQTWEGPQPKAKLTWSISRAQVAGFALDCLNDPNTVGHSFAITGSRA